MLSIFLIKNFGLPFRNNGIFPVHRHMKRVKCIVLAVTEIMAIVSTSTRSEMCFGVIRRATKCPVVE
jgi:hypothetical protein